MSTTATETPTAPTLTPTSQLTLQDNVDIATFDSSTQEKNFRLELPDGRHFQINERLYQLLEILRTPMTMEEAAYAFHQGTGNQIPLDQLSILCEQLVERGVIVIEGQPLQPVKPVTPKAYLGMHFRRDLISAKHLAPIARLFQGFFRWRLAIPAIVLIVVTHVFAYRELSLQSEITLELLTGPLLTAGVLFSMLLHELGHLAACHRWKCSHGPVGFGLYFSLPIFYVDVTQSWRLSRLQRAIVDVGGLYLQMLCVPLALLLYWWTGNTTYLTIILTIDMLILYNLEPFMKLDGYWLLSDLTGVPNLHARTRDFAFQWGRRLLQRFSGKPSTTPVVSPFSQWRWWVRTTIWGYLLLSVVIWPLFMLYWIPMLWQLLLGYPALIQEALATLGTTTMQGDFLGVLSQLSAFFMPSLMLLGISLELRRHGKRLYGALQQRWQRMARKRASSQPVPTAV